MWFTTFLRSIENTSDASCWLTYTKHNVKANHSAPKSNHKKKQNGQSTNFKSMHLKQVVCQCFWQRIWSLDFFHLLVSKSGSIITSSHFDFKFFGKSFPRAMFQIDVVSVDQLCYLRIGDSANCAEGCSPNKCLRTRTNNEFLKNGQVTRLHTAMKQYNVSLSSRQNILPKSFWRA